MSDKTKIDQEAFDAAGDMLELDDVALSAISGADWTCGDPCSALCSPCPPAHCF